MQFLLDEVEHSGGSDSDDDSDMDILNQEDAAFIDDDEEQGSPLPYNAVDNEEERAGGGSQPSTQPSTTSSTTAAPALEGSSQSSSSTTEQPGQQSETQSAIADFEEVCALIDDPGLLDEFFSIDALDSAVTALSTRMNECLILLNRCGITIFGPDGALAAQAEPEGQLARLVTLQAQAARILHLANSAAKSRILLANARDNPTAGSEWSGDSDVGMGADDEGSPFLKLSAFMIREVRMHSIYL